MNDYLRLLKEFRSEIPSPDKAIAERIRARVLSHATRNRAQAADPTRARHSTRSRLVRRLVPVFALAVATLTIGLIAPWQHGPSLTARALAAVGDGPVIHAVLQDETGYTYIDLATGQETPQLKTWEIWYDSQRHFLHTKISFDDRPYSDTLETPTGFESNDSHTTESLEPKLDPALAEFVDGYRSALENGDARVVRTGTINGHDVTWIELTSDTKSKGTERIAIDETSSLPLRIEDYYADRLEGSYDIVSIETSQAGSGDFTLPTKRLPVLGFKRDDIARVSLSEAAAALPGALSVGESISGLSLSQVSRVRLTTEYEREGGLEPLIYTGLELQYGVGWPFSFAKTPEGKTRGGSFVWLEEAAQPQSIYGWIDSAVPSTGSVLIVCVKPFGPVHGNMKVMSGCSGRLVENGTFVNIRASSRELLLATARTLAPILQ
jgi:hypothetical protein